MISKWIGLFLVPALLAGCATSPKVTSIAAPLMGSEIRFTTAEPAPTDIDAFTFYWMAPAMEQFDTQVARILVLANGKEQIVDDDVLWPMGDQIRSDVSGQNSLMEPNPTQFRGRNITMVFRTKNGRIRFPKGCCSFAFDKKGQDGKINWRQPFKQINAITR